MTIRILSPEGQIGTRRMSLAPAPDVLAGCRVAVLDNGKPGAAFLMGQVAEQLGARTGIEFVGIRRKRTAATPCEEDLIDKIAAEADLVLTGTAD